MGESGELGERAQPLFSTVDPTVSPVHKGRDETLRFSQKVDHSTCTYSDI
jgi:hypothetical protein